MTRAARRLRPSQRVVLLRGLARGVQAARPQRGVLADEPPLQAVRHRRGSGARRRPRRGRRPCAAAGRTTPCAGHVVASPGRRRPSTTPAPIAGSPRRTSRPAAPWCRNRCGCRTTGASRGVDACADHRGLVAHQSMPGSSDARRAGVPDVDLEDPFRRSGRGAVRGGQHRVDGDDVVARGSQRRAYPRPDEAGGTGDQNPHGSSNGSVTPSCAQAVRRRCARRPPDRSPRAPAS